MIFIEGQISLEQKQQAIQMVYQFARTLREDGYRVVPIEDVRFSRAQKQFGSCRRHIYRGKFVGATITIGEICWHGREYTLLSTILHELIHAMEDTENHDRRFRQYAAEIGAKYHVPISRLAADEEWEHAKASGYVKFSYTVRCQACGRTSHYIRRAKFVKDVEAGKKNWRCRCGSRNFTVEHMKESNKNRSCTGDE